MSWPSQPLASLGHFSAGIAFSPTLQGRVGLEFPFAKVGDISIAARGQDGELRYTRNSVSRHDLSTLGAKPIPAGSLIFAKIGEAIKLRNQVVTLRDTLIDNNVIAFTPNGLCLDLRYIWHAFQQIDMYALADKTTVPAIRKSRLESVRIAVPPLEEQKRIAAILDKADAIRRKREQAIQLADEFLRSLFLDMFGDPVRNPKGWPVCSLDKLTTIRSGVTKGRVIRGYATDVPYMRVANVQDGKLDLREIKSIAATRDEVDRYRLAPGDILLTEGGDPDKLGRGTVWRGEIPNCIHQNHIFCIRLNGPKQLRPEFLSDLMASNLGKKYFLRAAKQTTGIASINKTQLSAFPVLLPPFEAQEQYRRAVDSTKTLLTDLESTLAASESFGRVLSQHAFRDGL